MRVLKARSSRLPRSRPPVGWSDLVQILKRSTTSPARVHILYCISWFLAGLGILSSVFRANHPFFVSEIGKERFAQGCSFVKSNKSASLMVLFLTSDKSDFLKVALF